MFYKCLLILFFSSFIDAEFHDPFSYQQYSSQSKSSCPHPFLEHGRVRMRSRSRLVKFMCMPRYELVGNRYATCRNGQWDVPNPVCVRPGCELFTVENAIQLRGHHDAWVVTFCMPGYKLAGSHSIYCNGYKWNATIPKCVDTSLPPSLSCDFEEPDICGWSQDELHDFDWKRLNTRTPSSILSTGPSYDHTLGKGNGGYYMYIESTSKLENNTARLLSPVYDKNLAVDGCFSFFYHMFGQGTGGLRIYQKPYSVAMSELQNFTDVDKEQHLLWEQWGNQGDFWYSAAPQLKDVHENFQIVIEGVRGPSFTSDTAIDDVALLQGENCTQFRIAATTPEPPYSELSCADRCERTAPSSTSGCECHPGCTEDDRCCADYLELCVYNGTTYNSTDSDDLSTGSQDSPQTEKLIAETTTTPFPTTTTSVRTTISTTSYKPTTKVTTKRTPTTTKQTTTKPTTRETTIKTTTTPKPTTPKPIPPKPITLKPTTTPKPTTTTKPTTTPKPTTSKPTTKVTVSNRTTTKVSTVPSRISTTPRPTTQAGSKTTMNSTAVEENKQQKETNMQHMTGNKPEEKSSSSWKTAIITIVVLAVFCSLVYLGVASRTARGRETLARLRGRVSADDAEVRYLNSNDDDL